MTPIEELVRQALAETPPTTSTTDPFVGLERRVRRARRWLAAGAAASAAAVVAAIVVPLAVLGGNGSPNGIRVAHSPTPSPSMSTSPGLTTLVASGAISVSAAPGQPPWMLVDMGNGEAEVSQPGGADNLQNVQVDRPAQLVVGGTGVGWVVGTTVSPPIARVTVVTTALVSTQTFDATRFDGAAVIDNSLYVTTGDAVERLDLSHGSVAVTASHAVPHATQIVATVEGHLWVQSGAKLVQLLPNANGFDVGATVSWGTGGIYATASRDAAVDGVWSYDGGRLISLSPKLLLTGASVAQGYRVAVAGRPGAVEEAPDGGLYVALAAGGLSYYSPASLGDGNSPVAASLSGVQVITMTADPTGGVDYVDDRGALKHWDPQITAASR